MRAFFHPRMHISLLITAGIFLTVGLTIAAMVSAVHHFSFEFAQRQAETRLQNMSLQIRDAVNGGLSTMINTSKAVSSLSPSRGKRDTPELQSLLVALQKSSPDYVSFVMADRYGRLVSDSRPTAPRLSGPMGDAASVVDVAPLAGAGTGLPAGSDVSQQVWFIMGRDGPHGTAYPSPVSSAPIKTLRPEARATSTTPSAPLFDYSFPVLDASGNFEGVLSIRIRRNWFNQLTRTLLASAESGSRIRLLLLDEVGVVLSGSAELEGHLLPGMSELQPDPVNPAVSKGQVTLEDGQHYLVSASSIDALGSNKSFPWRVVAIQPYANAMSAFYLLRHNVLIAGGVVGLIFAILASFAARRMAGPLIELSRAIESRIRRGSGTIPIYTHYYEVRVLSSVLRELLQKQHEQAEALRHMNRNLEEMVEDRTRELSSIVTRQQSVSNELKIREAQLRAVFENTTDAFISIGPDGKVAEWNEAAESLLGWSANDAIGQEATLLLDRNNDSPVPETSIPFNKLMQARGTLRQRVETRVTRHDGTSVPVEMSLVTTGQTLGDWTYVFLHDISERQMLHETLTDMALTDALTDLPNRRAFMQKLPDALSRTDRASSMLGIVFMDLDGFKQINDQLGHDAGDDVLRITARRLSAGLRGTDVVARLAGDEFVMILENLHRPDDAQQVTRHLLETIGNPYMLKGNSAYCTGSIGVALYEPGCGLSVNDLMVRSDAAMYRAKQAGKNRACILLPNAVDDYWISDAVA